MTAPPPPPLTFGFFSSDEGLPPEPDSMRKAREAIPRGDLDAVRVCEGHLDLEACIA